MEPYKFRMLIWDFNAALDRGEHDDLAISEVKRCIDEGELSALFERIGDIDTSVFEPSDWNELTEEWRSFSNAIDEGRKMGVHKRGICLLLGYALQSLQQRSHTESP